MHQSRFQYSESESAEHIWTFSKFCSSAKSQISLNARGSVAPQWTMCRTMLEPRHTLLLICLIFCPFLIAFLIPRLQRATPALQSSYRYLIYSQCNHYNSHYCLCLWSSNDVTVRQQRVKSRKENITQMTLLITTWHHRNSSVMQNSFYELPSVFVYWRNTCIWNIVIT